jgi:hypothetical protein
MPKKEAGVEGARVTMIDISKNDCGGSKHINAKV